MCRSNLSSPNHIAAEFDTVLIQCDLNYTGRWFPTLEWFKQIHDRNNIAMENTPNESLSASSFVIMQVKSDDNGAVIICKTCFDSSGNQVTTNASNIPDYVYHWNITVIVECEFL